MKKKILPYLLLTPMILIMGVLVFYPIAATFSYSLKYWKLTAPNDVHFIGFDNYINILKSESFWYSLQNTSRTDFVWNNHSRGAALSVFEY